MREAGRMVQMMNDRYLYRAKRTDNGEWIDVADDSNLDYMEIKAYTSNVGKSDFSKLEALIKEAEEINKFGE